MGKANKVKKEFMDAVDMVSLVQMLKDVADNKFYTLMAQKDTFRRFGETFVEFFRMISLTKTKHPLITNSNPVVGILVATAEGSFLGEFNNKVMRRAMEEREKHPQSKFIVVGNKAVDRLKEFTPDLKVFEDAEGRGLYETAVDVKNYLVDEIKNGRLGKVIVIYSWPKSFEIQKPRVLKLLPCDDLISKQAQHVDSFEKVIEESNSSEVIGYISNLWITTRLFEILVDTIIASSAAQANFLNDCINNMKKERARIKLKFRKAQKGDIDKGLRETFTARMMMVK